MKNLMKSGMVAVIAIGMTFLLSSCGKDDQNANQCQAGQILQNGVCVANFNQFGNNGQYGNQFGGQQCAAGQVSTQYGCLAQGNCAAGQGSYNGQCIAGNQGGNYNNGYNNGYNQGYPGNGVGAYGNCGPGMVSTQMGCLQRGPCMNGYGYSPQYNLCVPGAGFQGAGMNGGAGAGFYFCAGQGC